MAKWAALIWSAERAASLRSVAAWRQREEISRLIIAGPPGAIEARPDPPVLVKLCPTFIPGAVLQEVITRTEADFLAVVGPGEGIAPQESFFRRMEQAANALGAGLLYSFYRREGRSGESEDVIAPNFLPGSARDTFPLGPVVALDLAIARRTINEDGPLAGERWGGLADVLLRLARRGAVALVPEFLYRQIPAAEDSREEAQFAYVRADERPRQQEMEGIFTSHLRRTGAWLPPPHEALPPLDADYPVTASVVIPVRNRVRTIGQALESAATQQTDFPFNVLVVDNFSTDGTAAAIEAAAARYPRVVRLTPPTPGRGIGGCWELAVRAPQCGRYAVQLDSDDLYAGPDTLQRMVDLLRGGECALAVGSYRLTDADLNEIPPGVVDHREWTPANGHNNLLRVEGIGAPRAFYVPALRTVSFPETSYGEDYGVALALSRRFAVARLFEPVYLCRRWEGNSDSRLTPLQAARNHEYKDFLRSAELALRQRINNGL
jgi:hypothetical protein